MGLLSIIGASWHTFFDNTSASGASNAARSKHALRKSAWLFIFILGLALTVWGVYMVVVEYLAYPVVTTIALRHYSKIQFPAVTVCNQNRVDCHRLQDVIVECQVDPERCKVNTSSLETLEKINTTACPQIPEEALQSALAASLGGLAGGVLGGVGDVVGGVGDVVGGLGDVLGGSGSGSGGGGLLGGVGGAIGGLLGRKKRETVDGDPLDETQPADVALEYAFLKLYMSLDSFEREAIGHDFDEFILTCTFREGNCKNRSNFWVSQSPNYGNCYTFNSELNLEDPEGGRRVSSMSGPSFGLTLVLNLNQTNFMQKGQTTQAGARMVIHPSRIRPMTDEFGNDLTPNTLNSIAIQELVISREPAPYTSDCTSDWTNTNYTDFVPETGYNYTLSLCQRFCLMTSFQDSCDCFHPLFLEGDANRRGLSPCDLAQGSNHSDCVLRVIEEVDVGARNCSCNVECLESDYQLDFSQSQWPSTQFSDEALDQYGFSSPKANETRLEDNLIKIRVFFNSLNIQHISESAKYSWTDGSMISALGGALSLYLGISLVMAVEFVEFLIDIVLNVYKFGCRSQKIKDKGEEAPKDTAWLTEKKP